MSLVCHDIHGQAGQVPCALDENSGICVIISLSLLMGDETMPASVRWSHESTLVGTLP